MDLFDPNGNFITYESIINSNLKTNYVDNIGLRKAIFEYIGTYNMTQVRQKFQPYMPMPLKVFYKSKKGCKDMYNLLIREKKKQIISVIKWREKGYDMNKFDWGNIFELQFKVTLESKLQWMQYQILHRIVPTNNYSIKLSLKTLLFVTSVDQTLKQ